MPCTPPVVIVEGLVFSTSQWENTKDLVKQVGDDTSDPTHDGYDENIATGNNTKGTSGVQVPGPTQTTLPPPITEKPKSVDEKPTPSQGNAIDPGCPTILPDPLYSYRLSENYTVKDFCYAPLEKAQLIDAFGLSALQRLCNLKAVAINIVEPLRAKFGPSVKINSALRNDNTTSSGISQHCKGQAVDIQFTGWTFDMYWDNASWVRDNIKYDQFIFEHSNKSRLAWYHLSFNLSGNRLSSDRTKLMTMFNNKYSPGLQRFF